jgi:hypothetical protein
VTHYQWKEMQGLHVPEQIKASIIAQYADPNGERRSAKLNSEINFHWLSVNEPFTEETFDESVLKDSRKFKEFIDLEKNGASELIEILQKQKLLPKLDKNSDSDSTLKHKP